MEGDRSGGAQGFSLIKQSLQAPSSPNTQQDIIIVKTRKRSHDEQNEDAPQHPYFKRQAVPENRPSTVHKPRHLACPFFKKDPRRHWGCASFKTNNAKLSHFKQHIYRKHTMPHFCLLCGTQFEDPHLRDVHVRAGCRQSVEFFKPDGITMKQRDDMNLRSNPVLKRSGMPYLT